MSRYDDDPRMEEPRQKGPNWRKAFAITLSVVLAVVLAGGVGIYFLKNRVSHELFALTNYVADQDVQQVDQREVQAKIAEEQAAEKAAENKLESVSGEPAEPETERETIDAEKLESIHEEMEAADSIAVVEDSNVFNFLMVGVDRRDKSWNGNSDSMMLVSINYGAKRISVVSIMRDTYVSIPGNGYHKLNYSYAVGAGPLLVQTISNAFRVDLEKYAAVDFEDMIKIIDALGGIDLEWTAAEITVANGYMMDMCDTLGLNGYDYILPVESGTYHCGGVAAVAYARNRFVGNSDYARTERQRYVISQILKKVKNMNIIEMTTFATKVLPLITHNMKESDIMDLVSKAPELLSYEIVQDRIPYDGLYEVTYIGQQDMLVPFWEETISQLHETIYGDGKASHNSDNDSSKRTEGNNEFSDDFENDIINGKGVDDGPV